MGQHTLTMGFVLLALGLVALVLGLRGRRIDREPRCPSRRCRYALGSVIESRRASSDEPFPLTCPECGRTVAQERALRIGTRKKRKLLAALGACLLIAGAMIVGLQGYATWKSTQSITTMPFWLLLHQSRSDTDMNRNVHQEEIVRRARLRLLSDAQAHQVVDRVLVWQRDPRIEMHVIADALGPLHQQGRVTQQQIDTYWEQMRTFELRVREPAVPGEILPLEVRVRFRNARGSTPQPTDTSLIRYAPLIVQELRIGDAVIDIAKEARGMRRQLDPSPDPKVVDQAWPAHVINVWNQIRVPANATGFIDVYLRLQMGHAYVNRADPPPGVLELRRRVAVSATPRPHRIVDDPSAQIWLTQQMQAFVLTFSTGLFATVEAPTGAAPVAGQSTAYIIGDLYFQVTGQQFGPFPLEASVAEAKLVIPRINGSIVRRMTDVARREPNGWEVTFISRPERAKSRVDDLDVLKCELITLPMRVVVLPPPAP